MRNTFRPFDKFINFLQRIIPAYCDINWWFIFPYSIELISAAWVIFLPRCKLVLLIVNRSISPLFGRHEWIWFYRRLWKGGEWEWGNSSYLGLILLLFIAELLNTPIDVVGGCFSDEGTHFGLALHRTMMGNVILFYSPLYISSSLYSCCSFFIVFLLVLPLAFILYLLFQFFFTILLINFFIFIFTVS